MSSLSPDLSAASTTENEASRAPSENPVAPENTELVALTVPEPRLTDAELEKLVEAVQARSNPPAEVAEIETTTEKLVLPTLPIQTEFDARADALGYNKPANVIRDFHESNLPTKPFGNAPIASTDTEHLRIPTTFDTTNGTMTIHPSHETGTVPIIAPMGGTVVSAVSNGSTTTLTVRTEGNDSFPAGVVTFEGLRGAGAAHMKPGEQIHEWEPIGNQRGVFQDDVVVSFQADKGNGTGDVATAQDGLRYLQDYQELSTTETNPIFQTVVDYRQQGYLYRSGTTSAKDNKILDNAVAFANDPASEVPTEKISPIVTITDELRMLPFEGHKGRGEHLTSEQEDGVLVVAQSGIIVAHEDMTLIPVQGKGGDLAYYMVPDDPNSPKLMIQGIKVQDGLFSSGHDIMTIAQAVQHAGSYVNPKQIEGIHFDKGQVITPDAFAGMAFSGPTAGGRSVIISAPGSNMSQEDLMTYLESLTPLSETQSFRNSRHNQ